MGMFDIDTALMTVIETDGSDLHLKVPAAPIIRRHGKLEPIPDYALLSPEDTERTLFHMLTDENKLESFRTEREVDFSSSIPGVARFRVNAFAIARALRRIHVILVGEMRDEETVRTALSAAETGHLVLSTIHTGDAADLALFGLG